jgi:hypothetical protein
MQYFVCTLLPIFQCPKQLKLVFLAQALLLFLFLTLQLHPFGTFRLNKNGTADSEPGNPSISAIFCVSFTSIKWYTVNPPIEPALKYNP